MGPSAGSFPPAHTPRGVIATVKFEHSKGELRGELLELRDSTLLLLRDSARVVVCALIENGGHGSTAAAPAALRVFERYFGVEAPPTAIPRRTP